MLSKLSESFLSSVHLLSHLVQVRYDAEDHFNEALIKQRVVMVEMTKFANYRKKFGVRMFLSQPPGPL